jgi:hypothetical protein
VCTPPALAHGNPVVVVVVLMRAGPRAAKCAGGDSGGARGSGKPARNSQNQFKQVPVGAVPRSGWVPFPPSLDLAARLQMTSPPPLPLPEPVPVLADISRQA